MKTEEEIKDMLDDYESTPDWEDSNDAEVFRGWIEVLEWVLGEPE